MVSYFILGLLWATWLEWYTSLKLNIEWSYSTRILHIITWPIQLLIFLITFFKNL